MFFVSNNYHNFNECFRPENMIKKFYVEMLKPNEIRKVACNILVYCL